MRTCTRIHILRPALLKLQSIMHGRVFLTTALSWEGIFELLLEEGNADREWGPDYVTASSLFFRKFNRNID